MLYEVITASALPGQFAMVWIPGINELPMSVMITNQSGKAAFTVRRHGVASTGLFNVGVGDKIGVRGPYGNSFDLKQGKLLLVGGGTGLVPMMRLLTFVNITVITSYSIHYTKLYEWLCKNPRQSFNSQRKCCLQSFWRWIFYGI